MPRDSDKHNDSPRGRRDRPAGGKGRSGAARGPEKKLAKRGFGPKKFEKKFDGEHGDKPAFRRRDDAAAPRRDFGDKPKFSRDDRPRGDRPFRDRPARDGDGEKRTFKPRGDRPFRDRPARDGDGEKRTFKPRGDRPFRDRPARDGDGEKRTFKPRGDRPFRDRPARDGDGEKRTFTPRGDRPKFDGDRKREFGDRGGDKRSFKPRDRDRKGDVGDRGEGKRPYRPRPDRDEGRPAARFSDRKFGDKKPYAPRERDGEKRPTTPRGEGFRKDGDRPRGDRPFSPRPPRDGDRPERKFGGERKFSRGADRSGGREDRGPRKDFGDRPPRGDSKPWQKRDDRGRDDRRGGDERPRFSRSREDGARDERPKFSRPRPEGRTDWQEHPRSERGADRKSDRGDRESDRGDHKSDRGDRFADRPRRDNEDDTKVFAKRPAFGGRGAYRERERDVDKRAPREEEVKPKKAGERIAKVLARAGLASRRDAEELVTQGRVTVNGRVINSPALDVTANDVVAVDGKDLPPRERTRLFLYHKPKGLMTTHADPEGRPTVFDNLPEGLPRLISVGRLDFNTEGLLLLTNDGGLARELELPETGWLRRYRVRAHGEITQGQLDQLKDGIEVDGVKYGAIDATLERDKGANVWLVFAIREGKNREVRNVMAHLGLEVNRLIRVSYGPFQLGEIEEGQVDEVKTRVLREQLGEKVIERSGAEFARPEQRDADDESAAPRGKKPFKPAGKSALVNDRKGRRVLVQRTGSTEARARNEDENAGYGPPRRPKRGYHGKRDLKPRDE